MVKFHSHRYNTIRDKNYYPVNFGNVTDRQTESDAYEPTLQYARWAQKLECLRRA